MPTPTSPKKRSLMPSSPLRRSLRAAGHHLGVLVQVGKEGVTGAVVRQLGQALLDHELVKVKIGTESPEDRFEAAERLATGAGAQLAQILGRTLLLYRRHPEKPRFEPLPRAEQATAKPAQRTRPRTSAKQPSRPHPSAKQPPRSSPSAKRPPRSRPSAKQPPRSRPSAKQPPRSRPSAKQRPRPRPSARRRPR